MNLIYLIIIALVLTLIAASDQVAGPFAFGLFLFVIVQLLRKIARWFRRCY